MKKIAISVIMLWCFQFWMLAQESDTTTAANPDEDSVEIVGDDENGVSVEMNKIVKEEKKDTTKIKIMDKDINIIEKDNGTSVEIRDSEKKEGDDKEEVKKKKFKGHWTGLELGLNNFVDADFSLSRPPQYDWMDLNTGRSWNVSLNFAQKSIGLVGNHFGMVTGLGVDFNNYQFDGDNSIQEVNGITDALDLSTYSLIKTKLTTTYLNVPLLLELQLGPEKRRKRFYLVGGVIGSIKLGSHTKIVYREDGRKRKEKDRDDYNISPFRYGFTLRAGFHDIEIYGTYYPVPFFEKNKGPELNQFSIGICL